MRILHIITLCELGGAQAVVVNLANSFCREHEVIVAAGEGDGKMFGLLDNRVKRERIPALVHRLSPLDEIKAIWQMRRLYRKYRPDIIHLHSSKAGILGRIAFPKSKIVYTVHGFDSIRIAYRKFLPIEKLLQSRCAAIVGVSQYDYNNLLSEGVNHNVGLVYNGIAQPQAPDKDIFANIQGYAGKVLCIARLSPPKNNDLFMEVAKRMPNYAFIWIGNQHEPKCQAPDNVYYMGNMPNAGSYIRFADAFFLPSNYEGLPIVVIESLANGVPVVASSVGGIPELLDGKNGEAVENDATKMTAALNRFLTIHSQPDVQAHAVETYSKLFTVDHMVNGYLQIYDKIIKR